jgi:hypothetical protein
MVLEPGYWRDLSETVHPGDVIVAKYGPLVTDEIRLRVISVYRGGGVRVAPVGAEDDVDPADAEPRNLLICLKSSRDRNTWTMAEKTRGKWQDIWKGPQTLELVVRSAVAQYDPSIDSDAWPDLSIAARGLDEIVEAVNTPIPAGRSDEYVVHGLAQWLNGPSITLLAPIGREDRQWSTAYASSREGGFDARDHFSCRFMPRVLQDQIMSHFGAGSVVHMGQTPRWKEYANGRSMLLVRPHWRLMSILPGIFAPTQEYQPVMSEAAKKRYRESEQHLADVAMVQSHHESQGHTYNPDTRAWSPPEKEE